MIFTIIKHNERVTASAESAEERVVRGLDLLERVEALLITVIYSDYSLLFIHVDQHHPSDRAYDLYNNTHAKYFIGNEYLSSHIDTLYAGCACCLFLLCVTLHIPYIPYIPYIP